MSVPRRTFLKGLGAGAVGVLTGFATSSAPAAEVPDIDEVGPKAFWKQIRALYPLRDDPVYLNTGGLGPAPQSVLDVVSAESKRLQEHSETGRHGFEPAREVMARFVGAAPEEVCFVRNATEGNSIIACGLELAAGDEVIFESHAHPGGSFPWLNQAARRGIKVRVFEPDAGSSEGNLQRVRELITSRTRVIQVSHITCTTGLMFPVRALAELARKHGAWFHIDGAQFAGMLPLDVHELGCDSYAFSGHKWLGSPHETGVLYIRRDRLDDVALSGAGAHSAEAVMLPGDLVTVNGAARHEYGTRNAALIAGLAEAVNFQNRIGRGRIAARVRQLVTSIQDRIHGVRDIEVLTPRDEAMRGAIVTFRHPRAGASKLFGYLMSEHRLRCRPVTEQGLEAIRISTHTFNSPDECDRVVAAVEAAARTF